MGRMMPAMTIATEPLLPSAPPPPEPSCSLADVLDRILQCGVALDGNLTVAVAGVDLLYLDLRLLLAAVDTVWPDGPPAGRAAFPEGAPPPHAPPAMPETAPPLPQSGAAMLPAGAPPDDAFTADGRDVAQAKPSAPVGGLMRLVLTLVKLLHDVLERQAVRRMTSGRLTPAQIENVGSALLAQAVEIERLRRVFGFTERDLAVRLKLSDRLN